MKIKKAISESVDKANESLGDIDYCFSYEKLTGANKRILCTINRGENVLFMQHDYKEDSIQDPETYIAENSSKIIEHYEQLS